MQQNRKLAQRCGSKKLIRELSIQQNSSIMADTPTGGNGLALSDPVRELRWSPRSPAPPLSDFSGHPAWGDRERNSVVAPGMLFRWEVAHPFSMTKKGRTWIREHFVRPLLSKVTALISQCQQPKEVR